MQSDPRPDDQLADGPREDPRSPWGGSTVELVLAVVLLAFVVLVSMHPVARMTFAMAGLFSAYVGFVRLRGPR